MTEKLLDLDEVSFSDDFDDGLEGSKIITNAQIVKHKPTDTEWFRVAGESIRDINTGLVVEMNDGHDYPQSYLVYGDSKFKARVKDDFKKVKKVYLVFYKTKSGRYGIWPISKLETKNTWCESALEIVLEAQRKWVRKVSNKPLKVYEKWIGDQEQFEDLTWEITFQKALTGAFEDFVLDKDNYDTHPEVIQALGWPSPAPTKDEDDKLH